MHIYFYDTDGRCATLGQPKIGKNVLGYVFRHNSTVGIVAYESVALSAMSMYRYLVAAVVDIWSRENETIYVHITNDCSVLRCYEKIDDMELNTSRALKHVNMKNIK